MHLASLFFAVRRRRRGAQAPTHARCHGRTLDQAFEMMDMHQCRETSDETLVKRHNQSLD
jgi:hypothetical protein